MARLASLYRASPVGSAAALYILLLAMAALFAFVTGLDPSRISDALLQPPSLDHLLGTDELGRDVLGGLVYGAQISLVIGIAAAAAASLLGMAIGSAAGFFGGAADALLMKTSEVFQVIPTFILAALIVALSGPGVASVIVVIALLSWPQTARIIRTEVMRVKHLEFVEAVRCLGHSDLRILVREIVPNAVSPALAISTLIVAHAILLESALSFFGLGDPDVPSWGRMLSSGQRYLHQAWWLSVFSGALIFLTSLAFNLLGDFASRLLNPRGRR